MSDPQLLTTVRGLIARTCNAAVADVSDDGRLVGYGLDSVRMIELLMTIEDEFGVEIDEHDPALAGVKTVRQLAAYIERRR